MKGSSQSINQSTRDLAMKGYGQSINQSMTYLRIIRHITGSRSTIFMRLSICGSRVTIRASRLAWFACTLARNAGSIFFRIGLNAGTAVGCGGRMSTAKASEWRGKSEWCVVFRCSAKTSAGVRPTFGWLNAGNFAGLGSGTESSGNFGCQLLMFAFATTRGGVRDAKKAACSRKTTSRSAWWNLLRRRTRSLVEASERKHSASSGFVSSRMNTAICSLSADRGTQSRDAGLFHVENERFREDGLDHSQILVFQRSEQISSVIFPILISPKNFLHFLKKKFIFSKFFQNFFLFSKFFFSIFLYFFSVFSSFFHFFSIFLHFFIFSKFFQNFFQHFECLDNFLTEFCIEFRFFELFFVGNSVLKEG